MTHRPTLEPTQPPTTPQCGLNHPPTCRVESETPHLTSCDPVTNTEQNSGRQTKIITSQPETRLAVPLGGGSGGTNTNGCGAIFDTGTGATTCIAPTYGGNANNSILTQTGSIALPNSTVGGLNGSLNSADWTKLIAAALAAAALGAIAGQALANQNQSQSQSQSDSGTADDSDSSTEPVGADASGLDLEKADERYIERVTGESAHAIKGDIVGPKNGSRYDIYVDKKTGEIYVLGKGGVGEPQPTGLKVPR